MQRRTDHRERFDQRTAASLIIQSKPASQETRVSAVTSNVDQSQYLVALVLRSAVEQPSLSIRPPGFNQKHPSHPREQQLTIIEREATREDCPRLSLLQPSICDILRGVVRERCSICVDAFDPNGLTRQLKLNVQSPHLHSTLRVY